MEPKVRFKGFEGEWKKASVKELCRINTGKSNTQDQETDGRYPFFIRSENIMKSNKYLYNCEAVITIGDGQIGKVFHYINGKFDLHQRCYMMSSFTDINGKYFYYYFSANFYERAIKMSAKATVDSVRLDMIADMQVLMPISVKEQQSIATYFRTLDSKIQSISKKLASLKKLKSASLVAMFPQNGESMPKVRFKGFEGEWRRIKFSKISSRVTRRNDMLECKLPLTISANEGLISQEKFFKNIVASSNLDNYYLLKRGEFAYNKSYSNGYPFGAIKRLDKYDSGVLSPLYICFGIHNEVDSDYICFFFETTLWHKDVAERATEGARNHGILNIGTEDFFDIDIMIPESKEEQQSIATFFRSLDLKIALETDRLEKLKQIKLACLDKMFV